MKRTFLYFAGLVIAAYVADTGVFAARRTFENIHVDRFQTVHEKFNKVSYSAMDPIDLRCARALFPHDGSAPCWWAARHKTQLVE